jgi:hypothetical protein
MVYHFLMLKNVFFLIEESVFRIKGKMFALTCLYMIHNYKKILSYYAKSVLI